ncbi:cytosolic non-specific dipeptidase-like [Metopolophium dirhodum]|uniref:cytosolic non-specific dipeptidase-like n=1 Tax=Metopolophium dirhodum TaxID=44670 RepID=UPI00298F83EB|nr:cytosolic non-specific dipeptidase-like [Metopolophium dirhodum]XP_060869261.1 cytosolic non-specific dipeptidase-like [Metopolophium dirhodum]XP_060869262.1 cytosolic non-specific dipeptidase-like [Metopolophium dirhodum]XP_060869263.1 cytosolic non-specific dipeptidase-like [Metopolophium dirhodum]
MESVHPLTDVFRYVDDHKNKFVETLSQAVSIKSISADPELRNEVNKMMQWAQAKLKALGADVELCDIGQQTLNEKKVQLPPVLIGALGNDKSKTTICLYGHLDVQPADISDGWASEPFVLTERNGKLYGRGSSDDKGPVLGWLHAIEAFQNTGIDLPVNLKFVFEGMEESGSIGLDELLIKKKESFLKDVDYVCISDSYWLGTDKPCLTYGLRGMSSFFVEVEGSSKDLHSGMYGGTVYEAMSDLLYILNQLVDVKGKILIPGIDEGVEPLSEKEKELYEKIEFDVDAYISEIGASKSQKETKEELLMSNWRYPSLSVHGIEGAFSGPGFKTVIPRKVTGKFSIRLVPNQIPSRITEIVKNYVQSVWEKRQSPNKFKIYTVNEGGNPWKTDPFNDHFLAAHEATKTVYNVEPDYTRCGGSIPVTLTLQEVTGKSVMLLPMGAGDDSAHSQNEKIDVRNYIEGTKLMAAYLYEVSKIKH